ncbi:MAG: hypothetical protein EOP06_08515 [Proteobacteria bacterium]|nr:MAG: hypothetical protein EOP06_08515 [Pseudomonadota bacterium]
MSTIDKYANANANADANAEAIVGAGRSGDGGPIFVPISFTLDNTSTITEYTVVTVTLALVPDEEKAPHPVTLSFYKSQTPPVPTISAPIISEKATAIPGPAPVYETMTMQVINVPGTGSPVWNNGIAVFGVNIDAALVQALGPGQTLLVVVAQSGSAMGMCSIPIAIS